MALNLIILFIILSINEKPEIPGIPGLYLDVTKVFRY
jgi:hypothetical protein